MNRNNLTTAVIAGIAGVAGIANLASAVNLNPDGVGQVLIYPYYTTNAGEATLLSVVNTTSLGKAVKVRFLEGYNSREVLDFNLFLSKFDVWTAEVFKLSDAGVGGAGAGIFTTDNSCTYPTFSQGPLAANGANYEPFRNFAYQDDGGPTGDERTLEGYFEMISMADAVPGSALEFDITHVNGVPSDCGSAEGDLLSDSTYVAPTSGLFGAASVTNVAQGTFYAYNADAIDGFTYVPLVTPSGSLDPSLLAVNDPASLSTATSYVFDDGVLLTSTWPSTDPNSRPIDAVSSLFDAANIYNEYEQGAGAGTDWVVTFPTKRFYVDAATYGFTTVIPPFEELFSQTSPGKSCTILGIAIYDREERTTSTPTCGFSPCPPGQPPSSICHEVNIITFGPSGTTSILGSTTLNQNISTPFGAGWVNLTLTGNGHDLPMASNGNVFHGLPITGFEAMNFVNNNVTAGVLANYSGVYKHRIARSCTNSTSLTGACS